MADGHLPLGAEFCVVGNFLAEDVHPVIGARRIAHVLKLLANVLQDGVKVAVGAEVVADAVIFFVSSMRR